MSVQTVCQGEAEKPVGDPAAEPLGAGKFVVHVQVEKVARQSREGDDMSVGDDDVAGPVVIADDEILEPIFTRRQQAPAVIAALGHGAPSHSVFERSGNRFA